MSEATKEKWMRGAVVTTTILAILAGISSLKASSYSDKIQADAAQRTDRWASFQARNIKEHNFRLQMEVFELSKMLGNLNPQVQKFIEEKVREYDEESARYEREREMIQSEAERILQQEKIRTRHTRNFLLSILLIQVAILISSAGMLVKKKAVWFAGAGFGFVGLLYMVNGFFLWF